jgi:hypothetical protein
MGRENKERNGFIHLNPLNCFGITMSVLLTETVNFLTFNQIPFIAKALLSALCFKYVWHLVTIVLGNLLWWGVFVLFILHFLLAHRLLEFQFEIFASTNINQYSNVIPSTTFPECYLYVVYVLTSFNNAFADQSFWSGLEICDILWNCKECGMKCLWAKFGLRWPGV